MFNKKLVLKNQNETNPYGLTDDSCCPLSTKDTIIFFENLNLTDDELILLNSYIKEDPRNSFYDNVYSIWDENGHEVDFITGLRSQKDICEEYMSGNIEFSYTNDDDSWNIMIKGITKFNGYIRCSIICNGSVFYTYVGIADDELWICFPHIDKATTLSCCDDIYWNSDELYRLLKNKRDAISIAESIKRMKTIIENCSHENVNNVKHNLLFK